jgi:dTMP kinase
MEKGKLIVLEGGDGAGKTTQLKLLAEYLEKQGKDVVNMHFPKHGVSFGKVVDDYLMGVYGDKSKIPSEFIAMLYMTDFYESKNEMERLLSEGKTIILSRFFSSTLSYQTALAPPEEREGIWQWIFDSCKRLPQPDLTLVLYVPVEVSSALLSNDNRAEEYKKGKKHDQHESDTSFQHAFMKEYDKNIERLDWKKIECTNENKIKTIEEIHSLVCKEIDGLFQWNS